MKRLPSASQATMDNEGKYIPQIWSNPGYGWGANNMIRLRSNNYKNQPKAKTKRSKPIWMNTSWDVLWFNNRPTLGLMNSLARDGVNQLTATTIIGTSVKTKATVGCRHVWMLYIGAAHSTNIYIEIAPVWVTYPQCSAFGCSTAVMYTDGLVRSRGRSCPVYEMEWSCFRFCPGQGTSPLHHMSMVRNAPTYATFSQVIKLIGFEKGIDICSLLKLYLSKHWIMSCLTSQPYCCVIRKPTLNRTWLIC